MTEPRLAGRPFWKMSGSGNDFVFFDARVEPPGPFESKSAIDRVCARATGVGADGIVFIQGDAAEAFRIRYFNRDGSLAELCGNASLCSARLAVELGIATASGFRFATDAGVIAARLTGGVPEIDLQPVRGLRVDAGIERESGELQIGFANTGVPHLVVRVDDIERADVLGRGRVLRHHRSLPEGANVNFVAPGAGGRWRMRTFERGVEAETLACGTGSVASAVLLEAWGLASAQSTIQTRSGRELTVIVGRQADGVVRPSLRGEGRIVFRGSLEEI